MVDVMDLIRQHLDYNRRREARESKNTGRNTQEIIYRKAGDDWF